MTDDELKDIWAEQSKRAMPITIAPEVIWRLAKESARFERTVFWRDTREWLATAFAAGAFLYLAFRDRNPHWLLVVAAIVACLPMTYVAFFGRKRRASKTAQSLTDHLRDSIASVQHQIGLLRSVLWWYLKPAAFCVMIVLLDCILRIQWTTGARASAGVALAKTVAFTAALFFIVWKANQRAVRKHLEPRLHALQATLAELET